MRIRPVHIWWLGVGLFTPSLLIWGYFLVLFAWKFGTETFNLGARAITHLYLPLLAALLGIGIPVACLRKLRTASLKLTLAVLATYFVAMLVWGVMDIRYERYQFGGHEYPNGAFVDGHRHYWHLYFTWYFMPYRWIHGYQFD